MRALAVCRRRSRGVSSNPNVTSSSNPSTSSPIDPNTTSFNVTSSSNPSPSSPIDPNATSLRDPNASLSDDPKDALSSDTKPSFGFFQDKTKFPGANFWAGALGFGIHHLVNTHCVFHGTRGHNVTSIEVNGFRESKGGMLGGGVYGAHSYRKAEGFAGYGGTVFCVRFIGMNVRCTEMPDNDGLWRAGGYDCVYCDRPEGRSEMCFPAENIVSVSRASGCITPHIYKIIDEFFLKNPMLRSVAMMTGVYCNSKIFACCGAMVGIKISGWIDWIACRDTKVIKQEIDEALSEAVTYGTTIGVIAPGLCMCTAAFLAKTPVPVEAVGRLGYIGCALAGRVASALPAAVGAVYALRKLQTRRGPSVA